MAFIDRNTNDMIDSFVNVSSDSRAGEPADETADTSSKKSIWVIATHRGCRDGQAAATVARRYYRDNPPPKGTILVWWLLDPNNVVDGLTALWKRCSEGIINKIRVFDVSVKPDDIDSMTLNCPTDDIKVFDHHVTTEVSFRQTEDYEKTLTYDVNECGATLAWKYYYPNDEIPLFLRYIRDRDLWQMNDLKRAAPMSNEVNEYLFANSPHYKDTDAWIAYLDMTADEEKELIEKAKIIGGSLIKSKNDAVSRISYNSGIRNIDGYRVYVSNAPLYQSDIGNYLVNSRDSDGNYKCDYALIWRYCEKFEKYYVSLRARKGDVDVSVIAKQFDQNGGGHAAAAGFSTNKITDILPHLSDNPRCYTNHEDPSDCILNWQRSSFKSRMLEVGKQLVLVAGVCLFWSSVYRVSGYIGDNVYNSFN